MPRPASPDAQAGACLSPADTLDESASTPPSASLPVDEQAAAPISPGRSIARVGSGPASAGDRPGGPTPGDWVVFQGNVYHANHRHAPFTTASGEVIEDFHTGLIALVYGTRQAGDVPAGSFEGNAQLLAAAPKLLTWLKVAIECLDEINDDGKVLMSSGHYVRIANAMRIVVAQAEGRAA